MKELLYRILGKPFIGKDGCLHSYKLLRFIRRNKAEPTMYTYLYLSRRYNMICKRCIENIIRPYQGSREDVEAGGYFPKTENG